MRGVAIFAATALVAVNGASAAPASHSFPSFFTPDKLALCKLETAFEAPKDFVPSLNCWRPRDGFTATLRATGRPLSGPLKANRGPVESLTLRRWLLPFGESWWGKRDGTQGRGQGKVVLYRCTSRVNGLTCRSVVSGRGFWIGRFRGHRVF